MKKIRKLTIALILPLIMFFLSATLININAEESTNGGSPSSDPSWQYDTHDGYEYFIYDKTNVYNNEPVIIQINSPSNYVIEWAIKTTLWIPYAEYYTEITLTSNSYLKIECFYDEVAAEEAGGVSMYYQTLKRVVIPSYEEQIERTESSGFEDGWYFMIRRKLKLTPPIEPPSEIITTPINDLPITAATAYSNDIGIVYFFVDGYNLIVQINYIQVYYLEYHFSPQTDMNFFANITEAYYINKNNDPSIFINHSELVYLYDIMTAPEDEKPAFVPHSIWDLKTNEIKTISEYKVLAYLKQMQAGPIVAYVYIDQFIMDKMISIQVSWTDRQENGWPMKLWQKYTKWEQHIETYTADDYLTYRNLYTNWEHLIPVWQFIRLGTQLSRYYEMPRIDSVNWNNIQPEYNITKNEVESYFSKMDEDFVALKTNPRFKTWAIALQGGKNSDVGFAKTQIYHNEDDLTDPMNFHIVHITYETNGKLYETVGDHMDLRITIHQDLLPDEKSNKLMSLIVLIFVVVLFFAAFKAKAFSTPKKALGFILATIIILAFLIIGYSYLTNGESLFDLLKP